MSEYTVAMGAPNLWNRKNNYKTYQGHKKWNTFPNCINTVKFEKHNQGANERFIKSSTMTENEWKMKNVGFEHGKHRSDKRR